MSNLLEVFLASHIICLRKGHQRAGGTIGSGLDSPDDRYFYIHIKGHIWADDS